MSGLGFGGLRAAALRGSLDDMTAEVSKSSMVGCMKFWRAQWI